MYIFEFILYNFRSCDGRGIFFLEAKDRLPDKMNTVPDSKGHGANMRPIWGRQDPGGPHVGPMNFAIWGGYSRSDYARTLKTQNVINT